MANINSINGNPIVVSGDGIVDGSMTNLKLSHDGVQLDLYRLNGYNINGIGLKKGYRLDNSGHSFSNNDHWVSHFLPVSEGMSFVYRLIAGSSVACICEYSGLSESEFVSAPVMGAGYTAAVTGRYVVPSGVSFIRVCTLNWDDVSSWHLRTPLFYLEGSAYLDSYRNGYGWLTSVPNALELLQFTDGLVLTQDGEQYRSGQSYHYMTLDYIPVDAGMVIDYSMCVTVHFSIIAAYDDTFTYIDSPAVGAGGDLSHLVTGQYVVPDGVSYIRISLAYSNSAPIAPLLSSQSIRFRNSVDVIQEDDTNQLKHDDHALKSMIMATLEPDNDKINWVEGHFIRASDGAYVSAGGSSGNAATPDYIPVIEGMSIEYSLACSATYLVLAAYDGDKVLVYGVEGSGWANQITDTYIVPSGVKFVRFSRVPSNVGYPTQTIKLRVPLLDAYYDSLNDINMQNADAIQAICHSQRYDVVSDSTSSLVKPLSILHFTDIHGTKDALERIVEFRDKNSDYIDDAICTGDMVTASIAYQGMGFWDAVDGAESILMTVGNHDPMTQTTGGTVVSVAEQYGMYIKPYMESWGNVVIVADKTWWYKDYPSNKIRLIGLGSSYMMPENDMTEQVSWLRSVLSGAAEADYSVIVAQHYMPSDSVYIDCNFTQVDGRGDGSLYVSTLILGAIKDFIDGGGKFVCHLCGHTHKDQVLYSNAYPDQLFINATTASSNNLQQQFGDQARVERTKGIDAFNVVTVDINRSQLKIVRVGADRDMLMRSRKVLCMNYSTKAIVYQG